MKQRKFGTDYKGERFHWSIRVRQNGNYIDTGDYLSKAAAIRAVPAVRQQYPDARLSLVICTRGYMVLFEKREHAIPKKVLGLHL